MNERKFKEMKTLDKLDQFSEEYEKEVQRENAYMVANSLAIIAESYKIPQELKNEIFKVVEKAEKIVGKEEFTIGLNFEN